MIYQLIHEFPVQASIAFWVLVVTVVTVALEVADGLASWLKRGRR